MNLIAYTRVSTDEQATSGLGLDAQTTAIARHAELTGYAVTHHLSDPGVSGSVPPPERPGLAQALALVRDPTTPYDGIVVAKLDRLSRSVLDFTSLLAQSQEEGWHLIILDLGVDTSTPNGRFLAHVIASVAQLERELIGQRIRAALQAKRDRGEPLRADYTPPPVRDFIAEERARGLTLQAIANELNANRTPTPRGGERWRPSSVRSVLLQKEVSA